MAKLPENGEERLRNLMEEALSQYPPTGRVRKEKGHAPAEGRAESRAGRRLPVAETLDLHGLTVSEALALCEELVRRNCTGAERRRVLIVHGKGIHSRGRAKLTEAVRSFLKNHPLVGEVGKPPAKEGGDGATWAVCRQRSR